MTQDGSTCNKGDFFTMHPCAYKSARCARPRQKWPWAALGLVLLLLVVACGGRRNKRAQPPFGPDLLIRFQNETGTLRRGRILHIAWQRQPHPPSLSSIDSFRCFLDARQRVFPQTNHAFQRKAHQRLQDTLWFDTKAWPLGRHSLHIHVHFASGHTEKHRLAFTLAASHAPLRYRYARLAAYPHDPKAYTQGLCFHKGTLYESTGQYGLSTLSALDLKTGKTQRQTRLSDEHFGEGAASDGKHLYLITWKSRSGFVYEPQTLKVIETFHYPTEGWGLAYAKGFFMMSDGSHYVYFYTPNPWRFHHRLQVYDDKGPVDRLNELEVIKGDIYANRYQSNEVVIIDFDSGEVKGVVNMKELIAGYPHNPKDIDVLNGIAYDSLQNRLLFTGKNWPWIFECKIEPDLTQ